MSSMMRAVHHQSRINPYTLCRIADLGDAPFVHGFELEASLHDIAASYCRDQAAGRKAR